MEGQGLFGIDALKDRGVILFVKFRDRHRYALREFDSLSAAYNEILGNVRGITWKELFAAYKPRGAELMSSLVGDREDWLKLVGLPVSS